MTLASYDFSLVPRLSPHAHYKKGGGEPWYEASMT